MNIMESTPVKILPSNEKKFQCQDCDRSFYYRMVLDNHIKKKHAGVVSQNCIREKPKIDMNSLIDDQIASDTRKFQKQQHTDVVSKKNDEDMEVKPRKKRRRFISIQEFNRFVQKQPIKWSDLPKDCIYKLEDCHVVAEQIAASLTNRNGITVTTLLPEFVVDKLLSITESLALTYLRPKGEDQVDIVTKAIEKKLLIFENPGKREKDLSDNPMERMKLTI